MWDISNAYSCVLRIVYFVDKCTAKYLFILPLRINMLVTAGLQTRSVPVLFSSAGVRCYVYR